MMNKKMKKFIHKVFQKIYIKEHIRKMKKINKNNKQMNIKIMRKNLKIVSNKKKKKNNNYINLKRECN